MKTTNLLLSFLLLITVCNATAQNSFAVEKTGHGQPILIFPGFACTDEVFDGIKKDLSEDYEVHAFTFAGFGGISPIALPWLPKIKVDIEKYIKEKNLKNAIIIGHSMGGTLGLWLASDSSSYTKVILIDALPAMGALMMPDFDSEAIVYDNPYANEVLAMDEAAFHKLANQSAGYMTSNMDKQKIIADWIFSSDRKTYVYGYTELLKLDLREALSTITTPVHILAATEPYGQEIAEINYKKQYKNLQNYNLKFAEGAGHFIMYDKPEWLLKQILIALKSDE